jgi:dipeptidase E
MSGKIFLSGGGSGEQTSSFDKIFFKGVRKIVYIPLAWPNNDFDSCLNWFRKESERYGKLEIKMLIDLSEKINLNFFDAVYIGGGNTYKLLKKIKESKFDAKLIKFYNEGKKIYGGSAGAIIFGADINIGNISIYPDENNVKLKNCSGFNLLNNYDIQCHFKDNQLDKQKEYLEHSKRNIIALPEESALLIDNNKFLVLGTRAITVIRPNEVLKYNPKKEVKL